MLLLLHEDVLYLAHCCAPLLHEDVLYLAHCCAPPDDLALHAYEHCVTATVAATLVMTIVC
jgi:hypothetical protein